MTHYHDTVLFDKYPVLARYDGTVEEPYHARSIAYSQHQVPGDIADAPYTERVHIGGQEAFLIDQMKRAVCLLSSPGSRLSRRALVDFGEGFKARCIMSWLFLIRDQRLRLYQHMRSNDLVVGMPNDLIDGRLGQVVMAAITGSEIGILHHHASVIQIYRRDIAGVDCVDELRKLSRAKEDHATIVARLKEIPILGEIAALLGDDIGRPTTSLEEGLTRYYRIMDGPEEIFWMHNAECTAQHMACVAHLLGRYRKERIIA